MCIGSWNPWESNHRDSPVDHINCNYVLHENAACTCTCVCKSTCTCTCTITNTLCSFYSLSLILSAHSIHYH